MNANELADCIEFDAPIVGINKEAADMLRQQQAEIEALKNAKRFIQNFAEEQHQRAVALEMRELTDEEIKQCAIKAGFQFNGNDLVFYDTGKQLLLKPNYIGTIADGLKDFAEELLKKAQEK
jgi:hypothetical protein